MTGGWVAIFKKVNIMAQYIQPNSDIRLIFNCPLKPDFLHTIRFANSTIQKSYFDGEQNINVNGNTVNGLSGITFNHNSYQRVSSNKLRIGWSEDFIAVSGRQPVIETIFKANYMYFKNTAYENIVIYAFITDIEYINNNCCEVTYIIDPLQTWLFTSRISMPACFVERLTIDHDSIGANTVPENLDIGTQYVENNITDYHPNQYIVLCCADIYDTTTGNSIFPDIVSNVRTKLVDHGAHLFARFIDTYGKTYSGLYYIGIDVPIENFSGSEISTFRVLCEVINAAGQANGVLTINLVPEFCFDAIINGVKVSPYYLFNDNITYSPTAELAPQSILIPNPCLGNSQNSSYHPHNKKLYQYPYNILTVSNKDGIQTEFKFEYFNTPDATTINFHILGNFMSKVETMCFPRSYLGVSTNYEYSIPGGAFGTVPFVSDTYKNWWAQNSFSWTANLLSNIGASAITAGVSATSPELAMAADYLSQGVRPSDYMKESHIKSARISGEHVALSLGRGITSIASSLGTLATVSAKPDTLNTKYNSGTVISAIGKNGFLFTQKHIDNFHKEMLDEYFSVYGYATHKWLTPLNHINERQNWTYIKTQNSYAKGNIPLIFLSQIQQIFDNGITFWNNPERVGNYVSIKDDVPWLWNDEYVE